MAAFCRSPHSVIDPFDPPFTPYTIHSIFTLNHTALKCRFSPSRDCNTPSQPAHMYGTQAVALALRATVTSQNAYAFETKLLHDKLQNETFNSALPTHSTHETTVNGVKFDDDVEPMLQRQECEHQWSHTCLISIMSSLPSDVSAYKRLVQCLSRPITAAWCVRSPLLTDSDPLPVVMHTAVQDLDANSKVSLCLFFCVLWDFFFALFCFGWGSLRSTVRFTPQHKHTHKQTQQSHQSQHTVSCPMF